MKRDQYDLYAGMDLEGGGGYQGKYNFPVLFPEDGTAVTSLGLYRPDWAFNTTKTIQDFMEKEQKLWVGENKDPSNTKAQGNAWRGIAHDIVDKTVITKADFITHFNTGNGKQFSVNGTKVRDREWFNRSLQDILPTWRWMVDEQGQKLKPSFDFGTSFMAEARSDCSVRSRRGFVEREAVQDRHRRDVRLANVAHLSIQ